MSYKTILTLEVTTYLPPTPEQYQDLIHATAQKVKELEYGDTPKGNTPQRIIVMEQMGENDTPLRQMLLEAVKRVYGGNISAFARDIGISQQSASQWVSGFTIRPHYWRAAAAALRIPPHRLAQAMAAERNKK